MYNLIRKAAIPIVILTLLIAPVGSMADSGMGDYDVSQPTGLGYDSQVEAAKMVTDTIIVRPLSLVSTVLGFGLFVISVPFSALGRNTGEAWHTLVAQPAEFTFRRPLGKFN